MVLWSLSNALLSSWIRDDFFLDLLLLLDCRPDDGFSSSESVRTIYVLLSVVVVVVVLGCTYCSFSSSSSSSLDHKLRARPRNLSNRDVDGGGGDCRFRFPVNLYRDKEKSFFSSKDAYLTVFC